MPVSEAVCGISVPLLPWRHTCRRLLVEQPHSGRTCHLQRKSNQQPLQDDNYVHKNTSCCVCVCIFRSIKSLSSLETVTRGNWDRSSWSHRHLPDSKVTPCVCMCRKLHLHLYFILTRGETSRCVIIRYVTGAQQIILYVVTCRESNHANHNRSYFHIEFLILQQE